MKRRILSYIFFLIIWCSFAALGQTTRISGTVSSKGRPLADINISLQGTFNSTKTDSTGNYFFSDLLPGNYKVQAAAVGFS
jgi:outer membrane receptor for ferrienterochelin and colicins